MFPLSTVQSGVDSKYLDKSTKHTHTHKQNETYVSVSVIVQYVYSYFYTKEYASLNIDNGSFWGLY